MGERRIMHDTSKARWIKPLRYVVYICIGFSLVLLTTALIATSTWSQLWPYILLIITTLLSAGGLLLAGDRPSKSNPHQFNHVNLQGEVDHSQLQSVLNSISMAILSVTPSGKIRTYNAAFLSLLDTNVDLVGKSVNEAMKIISKDGAVISLMDVVKDGFMLEHTDYRFRYDEDDEIRLGIVVNQIRTTQNKLSGYIFVISDITKQKSLEEERDEFVSVISHELRTPITVAEGSISNAQYLMEKGADMTLLKKMFTEAHEQIIFLATMVNDLGTLSRAERGLGDSSEEINIDTLAHDLYAKYAPRAQKKGLHFDLDVNGRIDNIRTSYLYLEEILQNFITNAIKYTPKGKVTLIIKRQDEGVCFSVKDSGIGISKSDQKRIFEKFYRSEDYRTRETSGTGLGLYVVQKLARKLGVKVRIESRLNHGSTFSFIVPNEPDKI